MYLNNGALLKNGEYRIEKVLAAGGFGITYLAMQVALGRKVAVKEFFMKEHCNRDSGNSYVSVPSVGSKEQVEHFKEKFLKEARLIASFDHSNIIRIHDVFEENGTAYYVMEYLEGESLRAVLEERGSLPEALALKYIREVSSALAEVHAGNLLHLDVKPANIMLNKKGEAVLIDFGISKHYDSVGSQTSSGPAGISEGYAPLEQYEAGALSSFTPATDVYSLGATLYFLVTGQRPPKAGDVMNDGLPVLPSDISPEVRTAIESAMQPRRKDRPQSVAEFLNLLVSTDNREQSTDNREQDREAKAIKEQHKAIKEENEETRRLEKETEKVSKIKNTSIAAPKKNHILYSVVLAFIILLIICIVAVVCLKINSDAAAERIRIAQIEQNRLEREEQARIAEQQAEEQARIERERLASEQRQGKLVDLGLSVYWGGWNVGTYYPEGRGLLYAWGETTPKSSYTLSNCKTNGILINISGNKEYDVARAQWGGAWRIPTKEEWVELANSCSWTEIKRDNKLFGYKITGPNGNSIVLPRPRYFGSEYDAYWSATPSSRSGNSEAYVFDIDCYRGCDIFSRYCGLLVRPVCNK